MKELAIFMMRNALKDEIDKCFDKFSKHDRVIVSDGVDAELLYRAISSVAKQTAQEVFFDFISKFSSGVSDDSDEDCNEDREDCADPYSIC